MAKKTSKMMSDEEMMKKLESRAEGRTRCHFIDECNTENCLDYLSKSKEKFGIISIPESLIEANEKIVNWCFVKKNEEVLFDMRCEVTKANHRLNKQVNTFKQEPCDIWQDRPRCISQRKSYTKVW